MNNYTKQLQTELNNSQCMPIFEIPVIDYINGDIDYINCDIYFEGNSLIAQREGVSIKEQKSKYIASTKLVVDSCFSLDEHLQELHEMVIDDIDQGGLYTLNEDS